MKLFLELFNKMGILNTLLILISALFIKQILKIIL
jgi:hypothetical protein